MSEAILGRRPPARFFCHRCNVEFEDVLQDYICPYCASGFIEQLDNEMEVSFLPQDVSDDNISNLDDSDDMHQSASHPVLNDLAFLMSGGRLRGAGRPETLLEQLVWTIGGGGGSGAITAGAPFVLVGAPGDYVFGGEGLDAVVTQLLGQLENAGPPPLPREQIAAIPSEDVTPEQAAANTTCSVCWELFQKGEKVSRLECEHIFHSQCIEPWLQLHATCPICRRSLLPANHDPDPPNVAVSESSTTATITAARNAASSLGLVTAPLRRVGLRRLVRRTAQGLQVQTESPSSTGSSTSTSADSSVTAGGRWALNSNSDTGMSTSSTSLSSNPPPPPSYNMDIDFD